MRYRNEEEKRIVQRYLKFGFFQGLAVASLGFGLTLADNNYQINEMEALNQEKATAHKIMQQKRDSLSAIVTPVFDTAWKAIDSARNATSQPFPEQWDQFDKQIKKVCSSCELGLDKTLLPYQEDLLVVRTPAADGAVMQKAFTQNTEILMYADSLRKARALDYNN